MAKPSVLFVCVKNGGKSQMAAAMLRQRLGEQVQVHSAGTEPGTEINPESAAALAEIGASLAGESPKPIDLDVLRNADLTVVLGREATIGPVAGMSGPIETWTIDEPSERGIVGMDRMRLVRDDLRGQVDDLAEALRAVLALPQGREPGQRPGPGRAPDCR